MRTAEEMLDEIENANDGDGPDPVATVDDPALARIVVAQMRLRRSGDLCGVFAGFRQDAGIRGPDDLHTCSCEPVRHRLGSGGPIDADRALQAVQSGGKGVRRFNTDLRPQVLAQVGVELPVIDKEPELSVITKDGKGMDDRVARNIVAADVQKP